MEDVSPKLYKQIRSLFDKAVSSDRTIQRFENRIRDGTATQKELNVYAQLLGRHASKACQTVLIPENLPNETLYFNIAENIIKPLLLENRAEVVSRASAIHKRMTAEAGVGLKPVIPPVRKHDIRVSALIDELTADGITAESVSALLGDPLATISAKAVDDFIQANAEQAQTAGFQPKIIREYDGVGLHEGKDACEWCLSRAGEWDYGEAYDNGVFERHSGCGCRTTFVLGEFSQDVWSKAEWQTNNDAARSEAIREKQEELMAGTKRKSRKREAREVFIREQMNAGKTFNDAWTAYTKAQGR